MIEFLLELLVTAFVESAGPWRYLFSSKYRRRTHRHWRRQSYWPTGLKILGALIVYAVTLAVIAFIAGVVVWALRP